MSSRGEVTALVCVHAYSMTRCQCNLLKRWNVHCVLKSAQYLEIFTVCTQALLRRGKRTRDLLTKLLPLASARQRIIGIAVAVF